MASATGWCAPSFHRRAVPLISCAPANAAASSLGLSARRRTAASECIASHHSFAYRTRGAISPSTVGGYWVGLACSAHARPAAAPGPPIPAAAAARRVSRLAVVGEMPMTSAPYKRVGIAPAKTTLRCPLSGARKRHALRRRSHVPCALPRCTSVTYFARGTPKPYPTPSFLLRRTLARCGASTAREAAWSIAGDVATSASFAGSSGSPQRPVMAACVAS